MAREISSKAFFGILVIAAGIYFSQWTAAAWKDSGSSTPASNPPTGLSCESMIEPLGIGIAEPRLSWYLTDTRRGALQTAYEIRVAASPDGLGGEHPNVWDSGRVESGETVNVPYAGPALLSRHRYYWQVRVWDQDGKPGAFSKASWWEMGLLSPADWQAKWITRDLPIVRGDYESNPKWIWAPGDNALKKPTVGKRQFRLGFILEEKPKNSTLLITAKDNLAVWVNGKQVQEASPMSKFGRPRDPWGYFRSIPLESLLSEGVDSIAVETIVNAPERVQAPNSAGLIALLRIEKQDGTMQRLVSGPQWKSGVGLTDQSWVAKEFDDSKWPNAEVIANIGEAPLGTPWPAESISLLRRDFPVSKKVRAARIYSTALGTYQLYLNGKRVGDDILAPGWTDYKQRVVYQVYDVTSQIRSGANAIGAILAGGWYADGLGWVQNRYNFGPPPIRVTAQIEIEYADGTRDVIPTDQTWKAAQSPILASDIYNGETYDARLEQKGWDQPSFSEKGWTVAAIVPPPQSLLVAQDFQPIRAHETLAPKSMTNPTPGSYVFDLGQNMVGWARLRVSGNKGTKIRLRFGEVLKPNGELYTDNLRTAEATDTYILRGGGAEVFEPHFTFHGFRYVELTGYPGAPPRDAVQGIVFYTSAPFSATFQSANPMVNQLWRNILWGQRGNFVGVPTDCPQRDERLGWMGDAEVFWRAASFNANLAAFSHKFTTDIRDAQSPAGAYADVSPRVGPTGESVAGWADAGVIIPWTAYMHYRDKRIVEENWAAMEKWMEHLESSNPNYLWLKERGNDYGDWLAIGSETPKDLIATAYWAYDATLMKRMAAVLGRTSEAEKYSQLFGKIQTAFKQAFVKPDGTVGTGSQTSLVLALHMDLLPEAQRAAAAQRLADDIKAHDWHLTTGFLGTPYLLIELSKSGHSDVAYRLLLQKTYPSWGYMIERGATTMWERWNGDQKLDDPSMNSFNHYAYGAVAEWLYRYVAGIDSDPDDPGFHRIVLHPQFSSELGEAQATYDSVYGPISSKWKVAGKTVSWTVNIPANTTALLYFPASPGTGISEHGAAVRQGNGIKSVRNENGQTICEVGSGSYEFSFKL
ncbi:MAG: family 78 glycoside hydrolase catalytic domain [Candidatus Acidiferrum sp.]